MGRIKLGVLFLSPKVQIGPTNKDRAVQSEIREAKVQPKCERGKGGGGKTD